MTTTYEFSRLASAAYTASGDDIVVDNKTFEWQANSDNILGFTKEDPGFFGVYYKDPQGKIVISYRGTDDFADLTADLAWGTIWPVAHPPLQVLDAYNFYMAVVAAEGASADISFTGHSLGGGLAGTIAAMVGAEAVLFAPAPFEETAQQVEDGETWVGANPGTIPPATGGALDSSSITTYRIDEEIVGEIAWDSAGAGSVLGSLTVWGSPVVADSVYATSEYFLANTTGDMAVALHGMIPHVFAAYVDDKISSSSTSAFNDLTSGLPRLIPQLVNDAVAKRAKNDDTTDAAELLTDLMSDAHIAVFTDLMTNLEMLASVPIGSTALEDPEINTALIQIMIEHAARKVDGQNIGSMPVTVENGLLHVDPNGIVGFLGTDLVQQYMAEGLPEKIGLETGWLDGWLGNHAYAVAAEDFFSVSDTIQVQASGNAAVTIEDGAVPGDEISNDLMIGGSSGDTLKGGLGNDYLYGADSNDVLDGGAGTNLLDGGEGNDIVEYSTRGNGVSIEIGGGTSKENNANLIRVRDDTLGSDDLLANIEIVGGTNHVDTLVLKNASDEGLTRMEFIDLGTQGVGERDKVDASALSGGIQADFSDSEYQTILSKATDGLLVVKNAETLIATSFDDEVKLGGSANNVVDAGAGNDTIDVNHAVGATIFGGAGDDTAGNLGDGSIFHGGAGVDTLVIGTDNVLFADADGSDKLVIGTQVLTGAYSMSTSERAVVDDRFGLVSYGKNGQGELVLTSTVNGANTFVANYDEGTQTAGITIGQIIFNAYRLISEDFPGMQVMYDGMEDALDLISQVVKGVPWQGINDPLVLDLDGDGIELLGQSSASPLFDIDGDGFAEHTGWVNGNDGFLVVDANANGMIDDVTEMFGSATESGFTELSTYDTNLDGVVDATDTNFAELKVWRDANGNGVTDTGELVSLADLDIASISLTTSTVGAGMVGTNEITATGTFTYGNGTTGTLGDVNFDADQFNTVNQGDTTVSAAAAAEANLKGHGILADLHVAMTQNAALLSLVSTTVPGMTSNSLADLRADALPILEAWGATAAGAGPVPHDVPMLTHLDANGKTVVDDFGVYNSATDSWGWASGADVLDGNGLPIAAPTYAELLAHDPGTSSWHTFTGESIAFLEAYFGEPIFLLDDAVNTGSAVVAAAETYLEKMIEIMDLAAVRLAMQGGLSSYFPNIEYDIASENFVATDSRQLISTYEQILTNLPANAAEHVTYISNWAGIMNVVVGDFDRGGSHLQNTYNFIFANLVAAHESIQPAMALIDIAEGFAIPSGLIVTGAGTMTGTVENDIFYMDSADQTAEGGVGFDVYVFGKNFGNDTINDVELATEVHSNDLIRFADYASTDITATRDGLDLILTVTGTSNSVRVVNQFTIVEPGLFGGQLTDDNGIAEISFADGVVWGSRDIAKAVANPQATSDTLMGTQELDYLDGGAGDDYLEGGDSADIYVFNRGYGADTIEDNQDNILLKGDDAVLFGDQVALSDLEFSRTGGSHDVTIGLKNTADSLTIKNQFDAYQTGSFGVVWLDRIEMFFFSDKTMISWEDVMNYTMASYISDGDDAVFGFYRSDYIDAGTGNDYMSGRNHGDTYVFGRGYGQDTIEEFADSDIDITAAGDDRVVFKEGIAAADLTFERIGSTNDLKVSVDGDASTLTIKDQFQSHYTVFGQKWFDRVEQFEFDDGTILSWEQVLLSAHARQKTDGDDQIFGFDYQDTLDGGLGNDYLSGGNENDTYIFGLGYGVDTIREGIPNVLGGLEDNVTFKSDITTSMIVLSRAGDDLVISIDGTTDQLIVERQFSYGSLGYGSYEEIEEFRFSDGTIWTDHDVRVKLLEGTAGDDTLLGFFSDDVLDGSLGNDRLEGGDGVDTYKFDIGYGQDVIYDHMSIISYEYTQDVVQFGAGVLAANTNIARVGDDLVLTFAGATDTLTVEDQFKIFTSGNYWDSIETFVFSDGTTWTMSDLFASLLTGTAGDDTLIGSAGADTLDGGAGNDLLQGDFGNDTYVFGVGYGQDTIHENRISAYHSQADKVTFDATVSVADVVISRIGDDVIFTLTSGDSLTVTDYFKTVYNRIESFEFSDGTVWTESDLYAALLAGTAGDDLLIGSAGADTLDGGAGNDLLKGGFGDDTYVFGVGYGQDTIHEDKISVHHSQADKISFDATVAVADVTVTQAGNDLVLTLSSGDVLTVKDHFYTEYNRIESFEFSDGTVLSRVQIEGMISGAPGLPTINGTSADDTINGTGDDEIIDGKEGNDTINAKNGDDILIGGLGDDTLNGDRGSDTFIWGSGVGNDTIDEYGYDAGAIDTLKLEGLNVADVTFTRSFSPDTLDLLVTINATGEQLTVDQHFQSTQYGLEQVEFADGTLWDRAKIYAEAWIRGTSGNDTIKGSSGDNIIDGGLGDDTLNGDRGSDTFIWGSGVGNDTIDEYGYDAGAIDTLKLEGLNVADVTFTRSFSPDTLDLLVTINATGEQLTVDQHFQSTQYGLEQVEFADGTLWDRAKIYAEAWIRGTSGNDTIKGSSGDNIIDGGLGDDTLNGDRGSDTFIWGSGVGNDTIDEYGYDAGAIDTLKLQGLNAADVTFSRLYSPNTVDMLVTVNATGEQLTIDQQFHSTQYGLEQVEFADGTLWNSAQILTNAWMRGTIGNDTITGSIGDNTIDGGLGDDTLNGDRGSDTFIWGSGVGNDTIDEYGYDVGAIDTLKLQGLNAADVTFSRLYSPNTVDMLVTVNATGEQLTIDQQFHSTQYGLEQVEFADGTLWNSAQILANAWMRGTIGNDTITGSIGNNTIDGGLGDDTLNGGGGDDTFVFTDTDGIDVVQNFSAGLSGGDVIRIASVGVTTYAQLQALMSENAGDTTIAFDASNSIKLEGVGLADLDQTDFQFV